MPEDPTPPQDPSATPAPDPTDPSPTPDPTDPSPTPDPHVESNPGPADNGDGTAQYIREMAARGVDVTKYTSEQAFWDGMAAQSSLVGRRSEAEAALAAIQERMGDDDFSALLAGQSLQKPEPTPPVVEPGEKITESTIARWKVLEQQGKLSETDARAWGEHVAKQEAVATALVNGEIPDTVKDSLLGLLKEEIETFKHETQKEQEERLAKTQEQGRLDEFHRAHEKELYLNPALGRNGGLTALGSQVEKLYAEDPSLQNMPHGSARLELAYRLAAPQPTKVPDPVTPPPTAKHTPGTNATQKQLTRTEYLKKFPKVDFATMCEYEEKYGFAAENKP